jgi:hypothetical protein
MSNPATDWAVLAGILAVLGLIAFYFNRRTFRIAALVAAAAAIATLTWFGLTLRGNPGSYVSAFRLGANRLAQVMFGPLLPGGVSRSVAPARRTRHFS